MKAKLHFRFATERRICGVRMTPQMTAGNDFNDTAITSTSIDAEAPVIWHMQSIPIKWWDTIYRGFSGDSIIEMLSQHHSCDSTLIYECVRFHYKPRVGNRFATELRKRSFIFDSPPPSDEHVGFEDADDSRTSAIKAITHAIPRKQSVHRHYL